IGIIVAWLLFRVFPSSPEATGAVPMKSGKVYEAEASTNIFNGRTKPVLCNTCSGGARLRNIGFSPFNYVVVNDVTVAAGGNHLVTIYYLLDGNRSFFVSVNGGPGDEGAAKTKNWSVASTLSHLPRVS